MSVVEAMEAMDFGYLADKKISSGADFTFTIIDAGFAGLDAWLETHPEWKHRIKYISLRKDAAKSDENHGFIVFQVATQVMVDTKLLLIETDSHTAHFGEILDTMAKNGAYFGTMSLGLRFFAGGGDPSVYYKALKLLEKYQFTILKSAGNYRKLSHVFDYRDSDGDGYLEFSPDPIDGKIANTDPIWVAKGLPVTVLLGWNEWGNVTSKFEVSLIKPGVGTVASSVNKSTTAPLVFVDYVPEENEELQIAVRDLTEGEHTHPERLGIMLDNAGTSRGLFNGRESLNLFSQYESPFLVSVGAFGKDPSGRLAPSLFSSIGHTNSGGIAPQIYGPGQLLLGGEEHDGTSYSTPFIASLYRLFADYNVKNVMEETTTQRFWKGGLSRDEIGRYGIPDAHKLLDNACTRSNRVENIQHAFTDDALVVTFDFSRACMQGLTYYLYAYAWGDQMLGDFTYVPDRLKAANGGGDVRGWTEMHSDARDIDAVPVRIEIPYDRIGRTNMGKPIELEFRLGTYAQFDPVSIPGIARDTVTLPAAGPLDDSVQGIDAAVAAQKSYRAGGFADALILAKRALESDAVTGKNREIMHFVRSQAALGLRDLDAAYGYYLDDADKGIMAARSLGAAGMIDLARNDLAAARGHFDACLDLAEGTDAARCLVGRLATDHLLKQDDFQGVFTRYGDLAAKAVLEETPAAVTLGLFMGKYKYDGFTAKMTEVMRKDTKNFGFGFFYLGLIDFVAPNPGHGEKNFNNSANRSGSVSFEALAAAEFLKRLATQ